MLEKGKNKNWIELKRLIIVAGHSIYTADNFDDPTDDKNWFLLPYQTGQPRYFIEHIYREVELANEEQDSLLVFSGGQTRFEAGPRTEAQSYWLIADHFNWWWRMNVKPRATTEEFATDSLQNLLFGICRFYECTGRTPEHVTVVSWAHKKDRFEFHRETVKLPQDCFSFEGPNKLPATGADLKKAIQGEQATLEKFREDPWGIKEELSEKRKERNPFRRTHGYCISCPWLKELMKQEKAPQWGQ